MFSFSLAHRSIATELAAGQFTDEESKCIMSLRRQFLIYPDGFSIDVNYRRLEFARWLIARGYLSEWEVGSREWACRAYKSRSAKDELVR